MILVDGIESSKAQHNLDFEDRMARFGDACFETIRVSNSYPLFYQRHYSRLIATMDYLNFDINPSLVLKRFFDELMLVIKGNGINNGSIRVIVHRLGRGKYRSTSGECERIIYISSRPDNETFYPWHAKGLSVCIYQENVKAMSPLSNVKSNNALLYILGLRNALDSGYDDCIILNSAGRAAEASSSNLFLYSNGQLTTPPLSEGCLDGVMRNVIKKLAKWNKIELEERSITREDILTSEELFFTNAGSGITWVKSLEGKEFACSFSKGLFLKLNERASQILERR